MTFYQGGKKRIGRALAEIIQKSIDESEYKVYRAPFIGMARVTQHIRCPTIKISDAEPNVVALWKKSLTSNWKPPTKVSKAQYERWKKHKQPHHMKAFVGYGCSHGGEFFGYGANKRNLAAENARSFNKTLANMKNQKLL